MIIENFLETIENVEVALMMMFMDKSCYIWLSLVGQPIVMDSLLMSMQTKYELMPLCTTLLRSSTNDETIGLGIAQRLAKRYNIQCFISCNLPDTIPEHATYLERKIS